jgi:midasin (ATPase involved in ribosome maturation)
VADQGCFWVSVIPYTEGAGGVLVEVLAKLVRTVTVTSLWQDEMKIVIRSRFSKLEEITEKIMTMFAVITSPQDHTDYPQQVDLVNTLRASRQVSVRDLVKWCTRAQDSFTSNPTSQQLVEILYQDAVDIFCGFIPYMNIRTFTAQKIAFTINISKDQAAFFSTVHKPAISLKFSGLQVGECLSPCLFLPHPYPPLSVLRDPPPCDQDGAWCRKDED